MDDWVVLAPTRWKLRKAIKAVNEVMALLRVEKHPDKTFIGRIARGVDFLGYWFSTSGLSIAQKTVERMLDKVSRLYEQGADEIRIEAYLNRWWQWVRSGVDGVRCAGEHYVYWVSLVRYAVALRTLLQRRSVKRRSLAITVGALFERSHKPPKLPGMGGAFP